MKVFQLSALISLLTSAAFAENQVFTSVSDHHITESCIVTAKFPMGIYKPKDLEEEARLCSLNFYNNSVALCPKTWSTSPGTIVNDFIGLAVSSEDAESKFCRNGGPMRSLAKFKQTMNQADTSGTFSGAGVLYYHFSRALNASVNVFPATYRTMDKESFLTRVALNAQPSPNATMNSAGWNWLKNLNTYSPISDILTEDQKQIFGVLYKDKGARYGMEINGTRAGGWGIGQNYSFQKTPAFLALKSELPLPQAIEAGFNEATQDPPMASAFASGRPSSAQMVMWMNELSEIAILDYIFRQQDRVGNIDYQWFWAYVETSNGQVMTLKVDDENLKDLPRSRMARITPPAALNGKNAVLIQKTAIGDNDAGGLRRYAHLARTTGYIEGVAGRTPPIRHLNPATYRRLVLLARDFQNHGPNYRVLDQELRPLYYRQRNSDFNEIINNSIRVAEVLETNCANEVLKLDLVTFEQAMKGQWITNATTANCVIQ